MSKNITFRTQLLGSITEFCQDSGLPLINNPLNLVDLIVLLARYKEEGVSLCPKVYLTNNINALIARLPGCEKIKIGCSEPDSLGIKSALKKCAPLAQEGWLIFIEDNENQIEYGLFNASSNPISVREDEVLMDSDEDLIVIKAFQIADECVEIRANNGSFHYIFLNHRKEDSPPPLQHFEDLVSSIVEEVPERERDSVKSYISRLLFDALRQCHGCIIAVTHMNRAPKFLSNDGIILDEPIDFARLVKDFKEKRISEFSINNKGFLLKGMLNSDGIILFDNKSRLLGYNCFVKVNRNSKIIGGARKRAFGSLRNKVGIGRGLCAVFMQSQDGWTEYKGK